MKTRIWIVLALVAGLVVSEAIVSPAQAGVEQNEWQLSIRGGSSVQPGGDDGSDDDSGPGDVEGDPENWLGGQNRPADSNDDDGRGLLDWFQGLMNFLTLSLFR